MALPRLEKDRFVIDSSISIQDNMLVVDVTWRWPEYGNNSYMRYVITSNALYELQTWDPPAVGHKQFVDTLKIEESVELTAIKTF